VEIGTVQTQDFEARATYDGGALALVIKGDASGDAISSFESLLSQIHAEAVQRAITEAFIDIRSLEFMSSSWFKCFVSWLSEIQALDEGKQYALRFALNPSIGWQKRSLRSLSCFAVDLIKIEA